ncbi:MAG TPA: DUF4468 domain-containing protein [Bacteroidales bacterium]|nr:DUF4468 domain-containing protein [Bacteroidales bacterium]HPS62969.1 DUF4468 domain-containing protein [Bacteroidales bacterium]
MKADLSRYFLVALLVVMACLPAVRAQKYTYNLPVDPETKKIQFREVVEQPGTPGYLYDKAIEWFGYYYPNPQSVYMVQSKENGKIEGMGRMRIFYPDAASGVAREGGIISYQIRIELKENKYRYTLTDFNLKGASRNPIEKWMNTSDPAYNPNWDMFLYQVDTTMQRLVSTLKEKMKPTVVKKDEW